MQDVSGANSADDDVGAGGVATGSDSGGNGTKDSNGTAVPIADGDDEFPDFDTFGDFDDPEDGSSSFPYGTVDKPKNARAAPYRTASVDGVAEVSCG